MAVVVRRFRDLDSLVHSAAVDTIDLICSIQHRPDWGATADDIARIVLTGGSAGVALARRLAELDHAALNQADSFPTQKVDWSRVYLYFGDERDVLATHPDSNEGQIREALLSHIDIPAENVFGYGLDGSDLEHKARRYEETIRRTAPQGFDLHFLGMGTEGHINSIFPHSTAVVETERMVIPVTDSPKPPARRATLTYPAIATSHNVWLLVAGEAKAEAASHVASDDEMRATQWPAAGARGSQSTVLYVTDDAASAIED